MVTGWQALLGSAGMGLALFAWLSLFGQHSKYLVLAGGMVVGLLTYFVILWVLKVPELRSILLRIKWKLASKG